jgi:hypothetical protein
MAISLPAFSGMNDDETDSYKIDPFSDTESSYGAYSDSATEYSELGRDPLSLLAVSDEVKNDERTTCIGYAPRGSPCNNALASFAKHHAAILVDELLFKESEINITLSQLEVLARQLLCRRSHQSQSSRIASKWLKELQEQPLIRKKRPESLEDIMDNILLV